ncbi:MAG: SH3 domain-containing protein, partial [Anaerolineae bacterium]
MGPGDKFNSIISLLGVFAIAIVLVGSLALSVAWLAGSPAQAAPVDPTPTVYIPQATAQPTAGLPTATPLPPTQVSPTAAPATVVAGTEGVNVRSGPGTDFAKVGLLGPGAEAPVIGRYGGWWQIDYVGSPAWVASWVVTAFNVDRVPEVAAPPTPVPASPTVIPLPAEPREIDEARWIDVDLSEQTLTAYENGVAVRTTLVSTGLPKTP